MSRLILLGLALLVAAGCGGSEFTTGQVSGTISLDGKPLPNVQVTFTPNDKGDGQSIGIAQGTTDSTGKYSLVVTVTEDKGAVLGENTVTIVANEDSDEDSDELDPNAADPIPAHDFSFDVKAGQNTADFNLGSSAGFGDGDAGGMTAMTDRSEAWR